jgi:hypothetical protein
MNKGDADRINFIFDYVPADVKADLAARVAATQAGPAGS